MSKNNAAIYLRAAQMVETGHEVFTCRAVQEVTTGTGDGCISFPNIATDAYRRMFYPGEWQERPYANNPHWANGWGADKNNCRILALCFAAAMAEAGDL